MKPSPVSLRILTDLFRTPRRFQDYSKIRRKKQPPLYRANHQSNNPQGKDATEEFEPIHPPDTLDKYLDKSKHLGPVDMGTVTKEEKEQDPEEEQRLQRVEQKPLLSQCYNLFDFEAVARRIMKKTAWGYYSSAADDEIVTTSLLLSLKNLFTNQTNTP